MREEVYPSTSTKSGYYRRFFSEESNRDETYRNPVSFLYIGDEVLRIDRVSSNFQSCFIAEHFFSARQLLENLSIRNEHLPDAIVIDVPFSEVKLREFITFLRQSQLFSIIPVIYNKKHIINGYKDILKKVKLADDIIDLDTFSYSLQDKISFLKEAKSYSISSSTQPAEATKPPAYIKQDYLKRFFDIVLSSIVLIILSPVFLLIAIAIKLESKGPVFYKSFRAGRGFKIFKFYKFRTMEIDADTKITDLAHLNQYNSSKFFKVRNDPRVTKFGAFLRRTSLDEFPQLINVLKGDMSLVGNRPLPLYEASSLTTNDFIERFMAPAGITGLWQIKKRGKENMSTEERISLDIAYARRHSLAYDLWIMANTPGALFQKTNA